MKPVFSRVLVPELLAVTTAGARHAGRPLVDLTSLAADQLAAAVAAQAGAAQGDWVVAAPEAELRTAIATLRDAAPQARILVVDARGGGGVVAATLRGRADDVLVAPTPRALAARLATLDELDLSTSGVTVTSALPQWLELEMPGDPRTWRRAARLFDACFGDLDATSRMRLTSALGSLARRATGASSQVGAPTPTWRVAAYRFAAVYLVRVVAPVSLFEAGTNALPGAASGLHVLVSGTGREALLSLRLRGAA